MSEWLASRIGDQMKFKRTPNWRHHAYPSELKISRVIAKDAYEKAEGVNIFAYVRGQFGLGEGARLYARALIAEGYPVAIHDIDIDLPHGMDDTSLDDRIGETTPFGINLIFVNPDYLVEAMASIGRERLGSRYTIACWFWELEGFPNEWLSALPLVDEVMVSTRFIEKTIQRITSKPVWHAPLPVSEMHDSGLSRADFGLDEDAFIFLTSFDFNSFLARKNPLGAIKAFQMAFEKSRSDVRLLIKSSNGHRHPQRLQELLVAAAGDTRIMIRDVVINRSDIQALQRCVDAYISMHRAEGFGLGLAECMRQGKPVVATAWSGNMEFMTQENSCLVDYTLIPVADGDYPHNAGQRWAEPSIEHASRQMLRLVEDPEWAASIGAQASSDIRAQLSPTVAAQQIISRLEATSLIRVGRPTSFKHLAQSEEHGP